MNYNEINGEAIYTTKEVSERLKAPIQTLLNFARKSQDIKKLKQGNKNHFYLWTDADILAFKNRRTLRGRLPGQKNKIKDY